MKTRIAAALLALVFVASAQLPQIPSSTLFKDTRTVTNASLANGVSLSGNYSNPSWITSLDWSKITGVPNFESPLTFSSPLSRSTNTVGFAPCGTDGFIHKYRTATGWGCEADQTTSAGSGITTLNGLINTTQSFANDTNITISSSGSTHTLGWTGTLAAGRLNSSVVHAVTNDTNITGSISAQTLTLAWTGTLAAARLNSNVVQGVTNDTNVTGSIAGQVLTLVWSGALAKARQHAATVYADQANQYTAGFKQTFTSSATSAGTNFAPYAGDPSTLFDGDAWYNSASGVLEMRVSTNTKTVAFTDSNITGNSSTTTAFATTPTLCSTGQAPTGILANGNATGCQSVSGGGISGLSAGKFPKASNATTIVDSNLTENSDGSDSAAKALTWASAYTCSFSSGGTTTCDLSQSNVMQVNFSGGNTTLAFTNPHGSGPYVLRSCQDSTGGRTYTFPGTAKGFVQPDPAAGTTNCTEQQFTYDGTNYQGGASSVPTSAWHGVSTTAVAFSNFPTCSASYKGTFGLVSDSTTLVMGATITGGGSSTTWMTCNGTNWVVGAGSTSASALSAQYIDWSAGSGPTSIANKPTALPPNGSAGGDLSGSYPNPAVAKVNGNTPGGTCTNQFVRSLSSSAVPTCASVGTGDIASNAVTSAKVDGSIANSASASPSTLTDGATITWAIGSVLQANATVTLGGSRTLNITGPVSGGNYVLRVVQDGTGSRGLTLGTGCTWKVSGGGSGAITPSTTASAIDVLAFYYDGTNCYANFNKNFN